MNVTGIEVDIVDRSFSGLLQIYPLFVHWIQISNILSWDTKSYLTHVILPRLSSGRVLDSRPRGCGSSLTGVTGLCPLARVLDTLILA